MESKYLLFLILTLDPVFSFAQQDGDKKVIITAADSTGLYEKIKVALIKNDFMIKELGIKDTIITYPRQFKQMSGYSIAKAVISGNTATLSGSYGLMRIDDWG